MKIVQADGTATVAVPADNTKNLSKQQWLRQYATPEVRSASSGTVGTLDSSNNGCTGGPDGGCLVASGESSVSVTSGLFSYTAHFSNSYSEFYWLGPSPVNADRINPSVSWWVSGVNVNADIPAIIGFSAARGRITWSPVSVSDTWFTNLSYNGTLNISASIIADAYFADQADFLFGDSWYHVQGG